METGSPADNLAFYHENLISTPRSPGAHNRAHEGEGLHDSTVPKKPQSLNLARVMSMQNCTFNNKKNPLMASLSQSGIQMHATCTASLHSYRHVKPKLYLVYYFPYKNVNL